MANLLLLTQDSFSPFAKAVSYLIAVLFVLFLAYISTRILGRAKLGKIKGNQIQLIDKFFISSDKVLLLVKIGNNFYFIGSDKTGMRLLDNLKEEDLPDLKLDIDSSSQDKKMASASFLDKLNSSRKGRL